MTAVVWVCAGSPGRSLTCKVTPLPDRKLVSAARADDRSRCLQNDLQVESERPVLDVVEVESHAVLPRQVRAAAHLPEASDAGLDQQTPANVRVIAADLGGQRGSR